MKPYLILGVNPGSTSTRIAVYADEECLYKDKLDHSIEDLKSFPTIFSQKEYRKRVVLESLARSNHRPEDLAAVVGRGGFLPEPLFSGTYRVDDNVVDKLEHHATDQHAANLGAALAKSVGDDYGKPAFIVDPVGVNETWELGCVSGYQGIKRRTMFHCLNVKAVARKGAQQLGKPYPELNLIVVHMGGGMSISAHAKGRAVDCGCGILGEGAFSPERAGTIGLKEMMSFVQEQTAKGVTLVQMERMLCGQGGIVSYLGTNNAIEVEEMIAQGSEEARLIYEAMAYQVAKDIGAQATVLNGRVDAILFTGGLAYSDMLIGWICKRVAFIAPVLLFPGEFEHEAMTLGVLRVLRGEEEAKIYQG